MKIQEYKNLLTSDNLRDKLEKIFKTIEKEDTYKIYVKCQALLEYINIQFLSKKYNIFLNNSDIVNIIKEYQKVDKYLFDKMVNINAIYNIFADNPSIEDAEYLLYQIDDIYSHMRENCVEV